jgi:hypothetical protein
VVDDASTDDTALIAAKFADGVVRLPGKREYHLDVSGLEVSTPAQERAAVPGW